jgi:hypothetical protein
VILIAPAARVRVGGHLPQRRSRARRRYAELQRAAQLAQSALVEAFQADAMELQAAAPRLALDQLVPADPITRRALDRLALAQAGQVRAGVLEVLARRREEADAQVGAHHRERMAHEVHHGSSLRQCARDTAPRATRTPRARRQATSESIRAASAARRRARGRTPDRAR